MVELAEILRRYGPQYREKFGVRMPPSHLAAMTAIEQCRTEALGGQVYQCAECGEKRFSYHSCQNRHCPKCQQAAGQEWLEQHLCLILPAAKSSDGNCRAADVQLPNCPSTTVYPDGFLCRKRHCGNRNQPQTATAAEKHGDNALLETSNGAVLI